MEKFKRLRELLEEEINLYNDRINAVEGKIKAYKYIENVINLVNSGKDVYLSQVEKIGQFFPDLEEQVLLLQEIKTIIMSVKKGQYRGILPDRIRYVLTKSDVSSEEIISVLNDFVLCEKLNSYTKKSPDDRIKNIVLEAYQNLYNYLYKAFQTIFSHLIGGIKIKYKEYERNEVLLTQKEEMSAYLTKLKRIKFVFNEDGFVSDFENDDDKDFFYTWINNSIPEDLKKEILEYIANQGKEKESKTDEETVVENREKVINKIMDIIHSREANLFDRIDISKLREDDKKRISEVKKIYLEMCEVCHERLAFTPFELSNREEAYFQDGLEWQIVLADIENNLVPNIDTDYKNIMNVFRYIIEIYHKEKAGEKELVSLKNQLEVIKTFIHDLEELLKIDNLYDTTYDYLLDMGINGDDRRYNGQYEYYAIRYFLRRQVEPFFYELRNMLVEMSKELEKGCVINAQEELLRINEVQKKFSHIMEKYQERLEYLNMDNEDDEEIIDDNKQNLVFCLDTIDFLDSYGNYDDGKRKELIYAVRKLGNVPLGDLRRPFGRKAVSDILYRPGTTNKRRKGQ